MLLATLASWLLRLRDRCRRPAGARIECRCRRVSASRVVGMMLQPAGSRAASRLMSHSYGRGPPPQSIYRYYAQSLSCVIMHACMAANDDAMLHVTVVHVVRTWWRPAMKRGVLASSRWINWDFCVDRCSSGTWLIDLKHCYLLVPHGRTNDLPSTPFQRARTCYTSCTHTYLYRYIPKSGLMQSSGRSFWQRRLIMHLQGKHLHKSKITSDDSQITHTQRCDIYATNIYSN